MNWCKWIGHKWGCGTSRTFGKLFDNELVPVEFTCFRCGGVCHGTGIYKEFLGGIIEFHWPSDWEKLHEPKL